VTNAGVLPLVLASTSPRRRHLLEAQGYCFETVPPAIEEIAGIEPGATVLENATRKALNVARVRVDALVLGVDTVVAFAGKVLGKPADDLEAFSMLRALNGRSHEVYSGVCLAWEGGNRTRTFVETTRVHFHHRSEEELRAYLARIQPLDKAGAYAAQEDEGVMIARIEGSMSNVIGLPMEAFAMHLAEWRGMIARA
jgi:septum formation protein